MIEKELIKLLLNKNFYTKNKAKLSKELFTNGTGDLYNTIARAHQDSDNDLTLNKPERNLAFSPTWFIVPLNRFIVS